MLKFLSAPMLLALGLLVQEQGSGEAYPGQSYHADPPAEFFCRNVPLPGEHECHCKRMNTEDDPMCENVPDTRDCESYCWANRHFIPDERRPRDPMMGQRGYWHQPHCKCPVTCKTGGDHAH